MRISGQHHRQHIKTITSTTPLQYQKELRPLEARRRLRQGGAPVTTAAFDAGYESPSQLDPGKEAEKHMAYRIVQFAGILRNRIYCFWP